MSDSGREGLCPECGMPPLDFAPYCENEIHTDAHAERKRRQEEYAKPPPEGTLGRAVWDAGGGPPPAPTRGPIR